jgi:hypothetical protein
MVDFGHELHYFARWQGDREFPVRAESVEFWRGVCPALTISDGPFASVAREARRVREDGYFKTASVLEAATTAALADGVQRVIAAGFHPLFVSVYDEFWKPFARLGSLLEPVLGGAPPRLLGDFWVWCVGPGRAPSGWAPHRDHEVDYTVGIDGRPTLLTLWLPFTDAVPENGCIYALPTSLDPNLPFRSSGGINTFSIGVDAVRRTHPIRESAPASTFSPPPKGTIVDRSRSTSRFPSRRVSR